MATRHNSRKTARRSRRLHAPQNSTGAPYRRRLRYEPLEDRRLLATVTVNTLADSIDFNDGLTSLREAIFATNLVAGPDTIDFAPALTASGPASIVLTQGELAITDNLTITGPGAALLTIDASGNDPTPDINDGKGSRIFNIDNASASSFLDVVLSGLTLTGGDVSGQGGAIHTFENLSLDGVWLVHNASSGFGGALHAQLSDLLITPVVTPDPGPAHLSIVDSVIAHNQGRVARAFGGGIAVTFRSDGMFLIQSSVISDNQSSSIGGGGWITIDRGTLRITDSQIARNTANNSGGGLSITVSQQAQLDLSTTSVEQNSTTFSRGGGIAVFVNNGASALLANSTISGNSASEGGGGAYVHASGGSAEFNQVTVSGNSTTGNGGGMQFSASFGTASFAVRHSTIVHNHLANGERADPQAGGGIAAGSSGFQLHHSIIAQNTAWNGLSDDIVGVIHPRNSLIGDNNWSVLMETMPGLPDANGNLIGGPVHGVIDPMLGPLADNGGPTLTHALLPGSPAINRGDLNAVAGVNGVPLFDQRGEPFARIVGGRVDIGAFEYQELSDLDLLVDTLVDESDGDYSRGDLSLREAIELANLWSSTDTIRFDPALTAAGPATILLTLGELKVTDDVSILGPGAGLLTIDASGNDPTPDENNGDGSRIFNIDDGNHFSTSDVTLAGLTLTGGDVLGRGGGISSSENLTLLDSTISGNSAVAGGGIYSGSLAAVSRDLTIIRSVVQANSAQSRGGAVYARGTLPNTVTVLSCHILGNVAGAEGGGLFTEGSQAHVEVRDSVISGNTSDKNGGGMRVMAQTFIVEGTIVANNRARYGNGGGISASGNITISNSSIVNNSSDEFPGIDVRGGGGLAVSGNVVIVTTTIAANKANAAGGGILVNGTVSIADCTVSGNSARFHGGGIASGFSNLTVTSTRITDNSACSGGGISSRGVVAVSHSTISGNSATNSVQSYRGAGGIRSLGTLIVTNTTISGNSTDLDGGGVWGGTASNISIINSTISNNSAVAGGGIWVTSGALIWHSTIANNSAQNLGGGLFAKSGTLQLEHSIIASNSAPGGRDATGLIGTMIVPKFSLIGWNGESGLAEAPVGSPDGNGNLIGGPMRGTISPRLGPLTNNGGATLTHALLPGSPAINAGDPAAMSGLDGVPLNDQRGAPFTRVSGGRIDIGAFESQPAPFLAGDFNRDYKVDAADYLVYRKQMGTPVAPGTGADANGDGVVNQSDYEVWLSQLGQSSTMVASATASREQDTESSARPEFRSDSVPSTTTRPQQPVPTSSRTTQPGPIASPSAIRHVDRALAAWAATLSRAERWSQTALSPGVRRLIDSPSDTRVIFSTTALDRVFAMLGTLRFM